MCIECKLLLKSWLIAFFCIYISALQLQVPTIFCVLVFLFPVVSSISLRGVISELTPILLYSFIISFFANSVFSLYASIFIPVFIIHCVRSGKIWATVISYIFSIFLLVIAILNSSMIDWLLIVPAMLTLLFNIKLFKYDNSDIESIEIVTDDDKRSHELANFFMKGAAREGAKKEQSNNILVSFSSKIILPPMQVINRINKNKGKAFIVCSDKYLSSMQYVIVWIYLMLNGYKVYGRVVCTSIAGDTMCDEQAFEAGGDYAAGFMCGLPIIFYPSPIFIVSLLIFLFTKKDSN